VSSVFRDHSSIVVGYRRRSASASVERIIFSALDLLQIRSRTLTTSPCRAGLTASNDPFQGRTSVPFVSRTVFESDDVDESIDSDDVVEVDDVFDVVEDVVDLSGSDVSLISFTSLTSLSLLACLRQCLSLHPLQTGLCSASATEAFLIRFCRSRLLIVSHRASDRWAASWSNSASISQSSVCSNTETPLTTRTLEDDTLPYLENR